MRIHERFLPIGEENLFIRHTGLQSGRPTLLFVHGLGESSLCFTEAFSFKRLAAFNLMAADNVGYGRSSRASDGDYSFAAQIRRLEGMVASFGPEEIILVGHSLGGILGTIWAGQDRKGLIRAFVNVEGNLTPADSTFSKRAAAAFDHFRGDPGLWCKWFVSEFTEKQFLDRLATRSSIRRYYASLLLARPEAFLANSIEMVERSRSPEQNGSTPVGNTYKSLAIPKVYLWGMESLSEGTREFLAFEGLLNRGFSGAGHWPMIDASEDFYSALADFLEKSVI